MAQKPRAGCPDALIQSHPASGHTVEGPQCKARRLKVAVGNYENQSTKKDRQWALSRQAPPAQGQPFPAPLRETGTHVSSAFPAHRLSQQLLNPILSPSRPPPAPAPAGHGQRPCPGRSSMWTPIFHMPPDAQTQVPAGRPGSQDTSLHALR